MFRLVMIGWLILLSAVSVMAERIQSAQMVMDILKSQYGQKTISGTMARIDWNTTEAGYVYNWTGKWPAMNTYDYISSYGSWIDYNDMTVVDGWWNSGSLVGAMWHWNMKANNGTDMTCTPGTGDSETSFDCSKISDTSSDEYKQAIADIDKVAISLKAMKELDIPVIWRPLHEAAGNACKGGEAWFWWGAKGATAFKALWRLMYDRLTTYHGLNNLIWVWTSQTGDSEWYPGDDYVDVVARDGYGMSGSSLYTEYNSLVTAYPNKIITLGECGSYKGTQCGTVTEMWEAGCRWSWFMPWYDSDYTSGDTHLHAGKAWWQDAMSNANVIDRDGMASLRSGYVKESNKQEVSLTTLDAGWNASYSPSTGSGTGTISYTAAWGAKGWSNLSYSSVTKGKTKLVIEFAEAPTVKGTIEGNGIVNTEILPGQKRYVMSVLIKNAENAEKERNQETSSIGQVLIKAATSGATYKLSNVYISQVEYSATPVTPSAIVSIKNVENAETQYNDCSCTSSVPYNIAGQRVGQMGNYKGLLIINGKKILK